MGIHIADISSLSALAPVEQLDLDSYVDNKRSAFRLPPAGIYAMRAPESFTSESFGVSRAGALTVAVDPTIAEGEYDGFQLRYTKVSAKAYPRKGKMVSQLGDYLRAHGFRGVLKTPQDLADAVETTAGGLFKASADWRAYDKSGFELVGMTRFPKLEDGTHQSWVASPTEKNEDGTPVRLRANLTVTNFIPAE